MTESVDDATTAAGEPAVATPSVRDVSARRGWRSADVMRTAALVIGDVPARAARLVRAPAVSHRVPRHSVRARGLVGRRPARALAIPRGVERGADRPQLLRVLVGFGAWMAPTLHDQGIELRRRLPDAIDRVETWINARRNGRARVWCSAGCRPQARADSAATTRPRRSGRAEAATADPGNQRHGDGRSDAARPHGRPAQRRDALPLSVPLVDDRGGCRSAHYHFLIDLHRRRSGHVPARDHAPVSHDHGASAPAKCCRRSRPCCANGSSRSSSRWSTIGVVTTVVLLVLDVKAAFALGLLAGLFEFIPTVGPIISALPAIAMGFLDSPEKALWVDDRLRRRSSSSRTICSFRCS